MKRFLYTLVIVFTSLQIANSQIVMTDGLTSSGCNFIFQDPGGDEDYGDTLDVTHTICSPTGARYYITFNSFSLASGDYLYIYEGNAPTIENLIGLYSSSLQPSVIVSEGTCLTFRFTSDLSDNGEGFEANITCFYPVAQSTNPGSPCSSETPATHFCLNPNPQQTLVPSTAGNSGQIYSGTSAFLGAASAGCLSSIPNPSWHFTQIERGGTLSFDIENYDSDDNAIEIDFACWGPFYVPTEQLFKDLLCNRFFTFSTNNVSVPGSNMIACGNSTGFEHCRIPNAQPGEWYAFVFTNPSGETGNISLIATDTSTAATNCNIVNSQLMIPPVCEGEDLYLVIQYPVEGATHLISGPSGYSNTTTDTVISLGASSEIMGGRYTLTVSVDGVEVYTTSATAIINTSPKLTFTVPLFCEGDEVFFSVTDESTEGWLTTYQWAVEDTTFYTNGFFFTPTIETTYWITATATNGCVVIDFVDVHFGGLDSLVLNEPEVCSGDTLGVFPYYPNCVYQWSFGDSTRLIVPTVTEVTHYTVTVIDSFGCVYYLNGIAFPSPKANFKVNSDLLILDVDDATAYFTNLSQGALTYKWNFGDTLSANNESSYQDIDFTYTRAGEYPVSLLVTNEYNCLDSAVKIIIVEEPFAFYLPNTFTPDGDGINDFYLPQGLGIELEGYSMVIYDRKSNIVFSSTTPGDSWNGRNRGGDYCPMDVYICIVRFKTLRGEYKEYVSGVTLIR